MFSVIIKRNQSHKLALESPKFRDIQTRTTQQPQNKTEVLNQSKTEEIIQRESKNRNNYAIENIYQTLLFLPQI